MVYQENSLSGLLLVEDDQDTRVAYVHLLESQGHRVHSVSSAEAGLEVLASQRFDLVITDLLLPGIDGAEFCRMLRSDDRWAQLPIVLITCMTTHLGVEITSDDFHWAPFTRILDKKYGSALLIETVGELLG